MSMLESVLALRKHTLKDLGVTGNDVSKIPKQYPEGKKKKNDKARGAKCSQYMTLDHR